MAGFSIVMMAFLLVMLLAAVMLVFEVISVLSIVFSAVSLSKSKKYISFGGMYDYRSVKRFHTVAVVFFVLGCIGAFFTLFGLLGIAIDSVGEVSHHDDFETFISMIVMGTVGAGKYIVLLILGIRSFKKFAQAKALQERLYANSARFYRGGAVNVQSPYAYTAQNPVYPYYQNTNVTPPVNVNGDNGGYNSASAPQKEENADFTAKTEAAVKKKDIFGDTIPDKICPKCGCANSGLYKYCTLCGEKLNL